MLRRSVAETKRPTSPTAEEILGLYFPVLDHGLSRWSTTWAPTRTSSARRGQLRLRHAQAERRRVACCATCGATSTRRPVRWSSSNSVLHADVHRAPVDPAPHRLGERVQRSLFADADAVLHAGRGAAADAEQAQQPGTQRSGGRPAPRSTQAQQRWTDVRRASTDAYSWLTGNEVARELARIDLPLSRTRSGTGRSTCTTCCTS